MSATNWKLENGLCRCCLSEGLFKDLGGSFVLNGQLKIYSDTLKDCLDIDLKPMDGEFSMITYTICESCIAKLQDVYNFKNQVLISEERFQEMYSTQIINECEVNVKVEINEDLKDENHTYLDDDDFNYPESDEDNKKLAEIKTSNDALKKGKGKGKTKASPQTKRKATTKNTRSKKKAVDEKAKIDSKEEVDVEIDTELEALDDVDGEEAEGEEPKKKKGKGQLKENDSHDYKEIAPNLFACQRCDKTFDQKRGVQRHLKFSHFKGIRSRCKICHEGFKYSYKRRNHMRDVHGVPLKRYHCGACENLSYANKTFLLKHIRRNHMMEKNYTCDVCGHACFSKQYLKKHMVKHSCERNFVCKYCKKSFQRKTTLDFHERIHTGDKRKVCPKCGQAFVQKASLNYHMKKYHPESV